MFERSGVHIDPRMLAGRLTPAERALVSLVIALDRAPSELSLLILDEVTASLPRDEAAPYLEKIAALAQSGVSVLMVTHRLAEVRSKASRMTVLRDGKVAYVGSPAETDDDAIIAMMVGSSEVERAGAPPRTSVLSGFWSDFRVGAQATRGPDEPLMEVEGLAGEQLADVTFTLHVGEILGLAGLKEAAIGELPLIVGEFDLSLGSMIGFLAMFGAYLGEEGFTAEIVIPGMLIAGVLVGLIKWADDCQAAHQFVHCDAWNGHCAQRRHAWHQQWAGAVLRDPEAPHNDRTGSMARTWRLRMADAHTCPDHVRRA